MATTDHTVIRLRNRSGRCEAAGFTLAELVVATTMISIVMAGVYTALNSAVNTWRFGETNYEVYDDARYALGLLIRELQSMPPAAYPWFTGDSDELEFYTVSPPMNVEDGTGPRLMQVTYSLSGSRDPRRGGRKLTREERLVESALPVGPDCESARRAGRVRLGRRHEFELARNVAAFRIDYYWPPPLPRRPLDQPPPWVDMIVEDENRKCWGLPAAVGVRLDLNDLDALEANQRKSFETQVVFRGLTSALPEELAEMWYQTRR